MANTKEEKKINNKIFSVNNNIAIEETIEKNSIEDLKIFKIIDAEILKEKDVQNKSMPKHSIFEVFY